MLVLFYPFLNGVSYIVERVEGMSPFAESAAVPMKSVSKTRQAGLPETINPEEALRPRALEMKTEEAMSVQPQKAETDDSERASIKARLDEIRRLIESGNATDAKLALEGFRRDFPDFPAELMPVPRE